MTGSLAARWGSNGGPHAVVSTTPGGSYTYDAAGNMLSGGGRSYTWTPDNQPGSISSGGVTESYSYDGDNERLTRLRGGLTTAYLAGLQEEDVSGTGVVLTTRKLYAFDGQVVAELSGSTLYYLHGDQLGSVALVSGVGSPGSLVSAQDYDPWGAVRTSPAITQTTLNYTGQRLDGTGLLYYHARYYDPVLARWTAPDRDVVVPADPQELNRYSYVLNNPLRHTDPTGHDWNDVINVVAGFTQQVVANNLWWSPQAQQALSAQPNESDWETYGRLLGDAASIIEGGEGVAGGGGAALGGAAACVTGIGCIAGAPVAVTGAAVAAYGGSVAAAGAGNAAGTITQAAAAGAGGGGGKVGTIVPASVVRAAIKSAIAPYQQLAQRQLPGTDIHHLLEHGFAIRWRYNTDLIPSVTLDRTFHQQEVTLRLFSILPTRSQYSAQRVWDAYKQVYGNDLGRQDWLNAIWGYFQPLGVTR